MKLYIIQATDWGYDEYESIAVLAENEEEALNIAYGKENTYPYCEYFSKRAYPLKVREVPLDKSGFVLGHMIYG